MREEGGGGGASLFLVGSFFFPDKKLAFVFVNPTEEPAVQADGQGSGYPELQRGKHRVRG